MTLPVDRTRVCAALYWYMSKPCFKTICYEFNDVLKLTGTCLCYFTASCRFWISMAATQLHFIIWPKPCVLVKASICFLLVWSKWTFKEQRFNLNKNKENFKWYMLSNFFYFTRFIFKKKVCCPRNYCRFELSSLRNLNEAGLI